MAGRNLILYKKYAIISWGDKNSDEFATVIFTPTNTHPFIFFFCLLDKKLAHEEQNTRPGQGLFGKKENSVPAG